jgi:hypothetical protein
MIEECFLSVFNINIWYISFFLNAISSKKSMGGKDTWLASPVEAYNKYTSDNGHCRT